MGAHGKQQTKRKYELNKEKECTNPRFFYDDVK
jgi:hypothetical protein